MESDPDSALHILQHMHTDKLIMSSSDRALYGLLLFQALEKNSKPLQPDSVINFSVSYYQDVNDKAHLAKSYFYKARLYRRTQHYEDATQFYLKALDCIQDKRDYALLSEIYYDMGDICFIQREYKESREKYQLAIECLTHLGKIVDASYRLLDIGRTYYAVKEYNTAQHYFRQALAKTKDSILNGSALQEIGVNYYFAKQYDSAQYYLRKSMSYPNVGFNYAIRCYTLADLYYNTEQYDSAYQYASVALKHPSSFNTQRECYRILANTEYLRGDFKQMAYFMTHFQSCTDSVSKIESQTKTTVLENVHKTSEAAGKTKQYLLILGWILPIIVLLSLYILYYLRKRNKGKEKQLVEAEVQLSEKQNLFIDSLIHQLLETKASQSVAYKRATIQQREQMDKELYNNCLHVNDWNAFKHLMNKTFNNIINTLESDYSDLTRKDLIWSCLFLLDIPNQDIALILDSQPGSLYKLKSRLTQKLNLKSTKDLDMLLKEISVRR